MQKQLIDYKFQRGNLVYNLPFPNDHCAIAHAKWNKATKCERVSPHFVLCERLPNGLGGTHFLDHTKGDENEQQ